MVYEPDHSAGEAAVQKQGEPPVTRSGKDDVERRYRDVREKEPVNEGHDPPEVRWETHHAGEQLSEMLTDGTAYVPYMFKDAKRPATEDHHV